MWLLLLGVVVVTTSGTLAGTITAPWTDFRAHISPSLGILDAYYYATLPKTANDANTAKWISPPEENQDTCRTNFSPFITLCPYSDPSFCLLYDKNGSIAALEFGIVKYNLPSQYPFSKTPSFVSKLRFGYDCYITTVYIIEQSVINAGGRNNVDVTGTAVWLQNGFNTLLSVPRFEADLDLTVWKKQSCIGGIGMIYQYGMNTTSSCTNVLPISISYAVGQLHSFSFQAFGKKTPTGNSYWMESVSSSVVMARNTAAPACLGAWNNLYGWTSMHVYFTVNPWYIPC